MVFRCLKHIGEDYVLSDVTPGEVNAYIVEHCDESYEIPPDVVIFRDTRIQLEAPMLVGFRIKKKENPGAIYKTVHRDISCRSGCTKGGL